MRPVLEHARRKRFPVHKPIGQKHLVAERLSDGCLDVGTGVGKGSRDGIGRKDRPPEPCEEVAYDGLPTADAAGYANAEIVCGLFFQDGLGCRSLTLAIALRCQAAGRRVSLLCMFT